MEIKDTINIANDFYIDPGARYRYEGTHSGQQFLEEILLPKFEKAVEGNYILQIEFSL